MKQRLIDANEYCEFLNTYPLEKAQSNFMTFYRDVLQHTFECEVKAIPIEFIKRFATFSPPIPTYSYGEEGIDMDAWCEELLEQWEKENE